MGKARDLTGQKFNRLTCIKRLDKKHPTEKGFVWLCKCDCGNFVEAVTHRITSGDIPSCGCQKKEGRENYLKAVRGTKKPRMSFNEYVKKCNFDNKYTLSCGNWKGVVGSEIHVVCPAHGESIRDSDILRQKQVKTPCVECGFESRNKSKTNSYNDVLKRFKEVHGDKYLYPKSNIKSYENQTSIITVVCPKHGDFEKSVQKHLSGQGCFECRVEEMIEEKILVGGYSDRVFEDNPEVASANGIIYYLKVGNMYKIGITRQSLNRRLRSIRFASKLPVTVVDYKEMPLVEAYNLEQAILDEYNEYRIYTKWSTELFNHDILNGKIENGVICK